MGVACSSIDPNMKKILDLKEKFPAYNREIEVERYGKNKKKEVDISKLKSLELKLWDHYKLFHKYKSEIKRTHNDLYLKLFGKDIETTDIEVRNVNADDMPKFTFFFNKREFHSITMYNCSLVFPRVKIYFKLKIFPPNSYACNTFQNSKIMLLK